MIYRNNRDKNIIIESNMELLCEITEMTMGYKVNYFSKGTDDKAPEHGARFKFMLGNTELGCVPMVKDPVTGEKYVLLKKKLKWSNIVNDKKIGEMIDIAIALTEYLGDVYVDFFINGIRENELRFLANKFTKIRNNEFKQLVRIGRPKVRVK